MPKYNFYKGRPCGSTARGANAWKKSELIQEARNLGLPTTGTIDDLYQRLVTHTNQQGQEQNPTTPMKIPVIMKFHPNANVLSKPIIPAVAAVSSEQSEQNKDANTVQLFGIKRDISHMTMRVSLNQIQFDIIKSGIQKSIRRCLVSEALSYGIEGDLFSLIEATGKAKGNRTNLLNRLRIILIEDLFDWSTIVKVEPWFTKWEETRKTPASRKYLLSIIRLLASKPKIRLLSDLKVFMIREAYRRTLGSKYDQLFNGWNDHDQRTDPVGRFCYLLKNKNPNCLYWYPMFQDKLSEKQIWDVLLKLISENNSNPQIKSVMISLQHLQSQLTKTHREKYLYFMYAIALILFESRFTWTDQDAQVSEIDQSVLNLMTDQEAEQYYQNHWRQWRSDNLPYSKSGWLANEIVIDKHTSLGRYQGKSNIDFVNEGSLVTNEDQRFYFPILRQLYIEEKTLGGKQGGLDNQVKPLDLSQATDPWEPQILMTSIPSASSASSALSSREIDTNKSEQTVLVRQDDLPIICLDDLNADQDGPIYGQKVTASWKPKTYLTQKWIYKGPYTGKRSNIPFKTVERYRRFLMLGDQAAIPVEVVKGPDQHNYLRSPNVGTQWPPTAVTDHVTQTETGRIVDRQSMGVYRGQELIDMGKMDWERGLYHFLIRYIINAGDAGLWNYINNYGIDYEEDRTHKGEKPKNILEVISNKPFSRNYAPLVEQAVAQYAPILKSKIEQLVLPQIKAFHNDQEYERTQLVLDLLSQ